MWPGTLIGGKLRGQGTYGCVFQPPLLCRGRSDSDTDTRRVGKITSRLDGYNEIAIAKYLNKLPESSKYVIIPEETPCIPRSRSKQVDSTIEQCRFSDDKPLESTIQLIMPWGGYPLSQLNLDPHIFDFFRFMEELLTAGTFLILNDICHFDIWGSNILFGNNNTPKIIDFGFAFRPSKFTEADLKLRWREFGSEFDTESPEVTLMHATIKNIPLSSICTFMQNSLTLQKLAIVCDILPSDWVKNVYQWSQESHSFQEEDWVSCWKLYWPGFDAWAFGVLLVDILEIQLSKPYFIESNKWKSQGHIIKKIICGLCSGHPAYRLDAAEALSILTNGSNPLISAGSVGERWIQEKKAKRPQL